MFDIPKLTTQGNPSVATIVFAVATGGPPVGIDDQRWAIGVDRWATDERLVGYCGPPEVSMKGPQKVGYPSRNGRKILQAQVCMH